MATDKKPLNKSSFITAALVAALPFIADLIVFGTTGRADRIFDAPGLLLFNAGFAAAPFILIGLVMVARKSVSRALWTGVVLSAFIWLTYALSGRHYHLSAEGGNANIAIFMVLMIWPFLVTIIMGIIGKYEPDKISN